MGALEQGKGVKAMKSVAERIWRQESILAIVSERGMSHDPRGIVSCGVQVEMERRIWVPIGNRTRSISFSRLRSMRFRIRHGGLML